MRKHLFAVMLLLAGIPAVSFTAAADPVPQQQSEAATTITGTVLDENNEPVIGASVVQKGVKTNAVATDAFGNFKLRVPAGAQLEFSYVGYKTMYVAAAPDMTVYLQPTTEQLNELVAIGYGTQKKANLTGAVATVDVARVMDSRPVQDVTKALQGAVPGLTITQDNGGIATGSGIRIRGVGTLSNGQSSSPLIVVDGVPVDDLNFVNPEDIADISVLKDASSSAIYGARAAFGVILITTKGAAKQDKVSVSYTNNFAWSGATTLPEFASTVDQLESSLQAYYRNPTDANAKTEVGGMYYKDLLPLAQKWAEQHNGPYTDYRELQPYIDENNVGDYKIVGNQWLRYADWDLTKLMFNDAAPSQKHNVVLEGTSGKTQYRLSFGYDGRQSLDSFNPDKMHRYMANANISTEITKWLKAGTRISYTQREYFEQNTPRNGYQYMWRWAPYMETYGWITNPATDQPLTFRNEIMNRTQAHTDKATTRSTRLQAWLNAEIIKGLNLQADFTYDVRTFMQNGAWLPQEGWNGWGNAYSIYKWPGNGQPDTRAWKNASEGTRWTMNVFATYAKTFAEDHNLKVMAGTTAEQYRYTGVEARKNGLVDYTLPWLGLTDGGKDGTQLGIASSDTHRATAGFFGRVNYDYKGIYLFEANGRYDGSSRFPAMQQWGFFPSFSAGYRFSEESYFEPVKSWWTNGKLRASYGHLGNEAVGSNMFISTISLGNKNVNWINGSGTLLSSAGTPALVSSSLTWERIITTDVGIDLGFLDNAINMSFDWYSRETKDMLAPGMPLPSVLGASVPLTNGGTMRTNGWELALNWNHSFGDADVWATFTIGDARSKVTKWDNEDGVLYSYVPGAGGYRFYEGQYYGDIWGFEFDRFFEVSDFDGKDEKGKWIYGPGVANQDYFAYAPFTFGPGDVKFVDRNGDGQLNNGIEGMYKLGGKFYIPRSSLPANFPKHQTTLGNYIIVDGENYDAIVNNKESKSVPVGTVDNHGDLKVVGNALPRYEYGIRLGGAWKGFDLDIFMQGVGKRDMWQISSFTIPFAAKNDGIFSSQLDYNKYIVDERGTITGYDIDQNNFWPAMYGGVFGYNKRMQNTCNQGLNNFTLSDRYLVNMAYLRMKNITFGYTIPAELTTKAYIQKARVYFSAENPFFIYNGAKKYGFDPEIADRAAGEGVAAFGRTAPMMKSYSFGIQVTF